MGGGRFRRLAAGTVPFLARTADQTDMRDDLAWETTDSAVDYVCPGFSVRRDDVVLPDGTETDFHYVEDRPTAVILPFDADGDVVVIEEWRQAVGRVNRGLPAGTLDGDDDDLVAAARRELTEETGYVAGSIERLVTVEPANGMTDAVHHVFVARDCHPTGEQRLDDDESIRVDTADYEDLLAAAVGGDLRDGRAVLAVTYYELTERER